MIDVGKRDIGITFEEIGKASVTVWSPFSSSIELELENGSRIPMQASERGYWRLNNGSIKPGNRYKIVVDGKQALPDPASVSQPEGVHGLSEALDLRQFPWTDTGWNNLPLQQYVIYELHTGTFTQAGTFQGIEEKLDYLKDLGITAIEIMPVAQFPGERNWGYDGAYPFAVQNSYGGPRGLQHLVNACHEKGLAVILDVVYNHLGPEGNYLGAFGPYFTDKYKTPWGNALNFDDAWCDGVRKYYIENALMWVRDFHIDALRLDAVHAIKDFSPVHILREIHSYVAEYMRVSGRTHYLIAELDLNDNRFINPTDKGGYGLDAQWIDEFHHALRVAAGGARNGYYEDFHGVADLAKAYKDAYVYDGQFSEHRKKHFGVKTENPGKQFVVFSQNHDQVGNRMLGERTSSLCSFEMQKLMAAAVVVSPFLPMFFMGEEWSEPNPFLYFVSHTDPDLAEAVREGRKREFAAFHLQGEAPDPVSTKSFDNSKLQWQRLDCEPHKTMHCFYKALIRLRKEQPALSNLDRKKLVVQCHEQSQTITLHRWCNQQDLLCLMNFSAREQYTMLSSGIKEYVRVFDTASPQWKGPRAAPDTVSGGTPGANSFVLQPQSMVIYVNKTTIVHA